MQLKKTTRDPAYPESDGDSADGNYAQSDSYYSDPPAASTRSRTGESAEGRAPGGARGQSVVDAHSTFDGRYETDQDLRVEGVISGEIVCRGELTIERDATANAKIQARDATIRGRMDGDLVCSGRMLLTGTAVVTGTMKAATLVVEEGASVRGTVETVQDDAVPAPTRVSRTATAEATAKADEPARETGTVAPMTGRNGSRNREVPSFALVSSDERATERN